MKKIVSVLLVVALLLSGVTALAEDKNSMLRDSVNRNIKVEVSADKTTLDGMKPEDSVTVTYAVSGGQSDAINAEAYVYFFYNEDNSDQTASYYITYLHELSGSFKIPVSKFRGRAGKAVVYIEGNDYQNGYWDDIAEEYIPDKKLGYFYHRGPEITVLAGNPGTTTLAAVSLSAEKEVYKPGEEIKINYKVTGLPDGYKDLNVYISTSVIQNVNNSAIDYTYESFDINDAKEGYVTITAPDFGNYVWVYANCYYLDNAGSHNTDYAVSIYLNEKPPVYPGYDSFSINVENGFKKLYLKKNAADQEDFAIEITNAEPDLAKPTLTYKSSEPSVATVSDKGVVHGVKEGQSKITCTVKKADGEVIRTFTFLVDVVKDTSAITKITPVKKSVTLKKGKKVTLEVKLKPATVYNANLKWETSDKKVATVNKKGQVTAKGKGKCVITVTDKSSGKSAKIKITVK